MVRWGHEGAFEVSRQMLACYSTWVCDHLSPASGCWQKCHCAAEEPTKGAEDKLSVANSKDALPVAGSSFERRAERRELRPSPTPSSINKSMARIKLPLRKSFLVTNVPRSINLHVADQCVGPSHACSGPVAPFRTVSSTDGTFLVDKATPRPRNSRREPRAIDRWPPRLPPGSSAFCGGVSQLDRQGLRPFRSLYL